MFGRRKASFPSGPAIPQPQRDSDGKRRIFGEDVFAKHGDMLRSLGFGLHDPANIIADGPEFGRRINMSLAAQDARRTQIENELLRLHGHNAIRPFFIFSEPVFNGELGQWLIRLMNLMPYDDWNVVYLPMDRETQAVMDGLPLHPRQSIGPIDALMVEQLSGFYRQYKDAKGKVDQHVSEVGLVDAHDVLDRFVRYVDDMPRRILDHVAQVRPIIIALIADVQRKSA